MLRKHKYTSSSLRHITINSLRRPQPAGTAPSTNRQGFSLVEILVSIGIIVLLGALIFPAVGGMLDKSKDAKCLSNLRQWGSALAGYLVDSNGELPYRGNEANPTWDLVASEENTTAWYNVLPTYAGQKPLNSLTTASERASIRSGAEAGIFQCPRAKWAGGPGSSPSFSYAFNSAIFSDGVVRKFSFQLTDQGAANAARRPVGTATIPMMADTRASQREPKAVAGMNDETSRAYTDTRHLGNRHGSAHSPNGLVQMAFFDGSVRGYKTKEIMDASGRNVVTSPVIWNPWNPDGNE